MHVIQPDPITRSFPGTISGLHIIIILEMRRKLLQNVVSLTFREKHRLKILEERLLRENCKREESKEACKPCLMGSLVIVIFTKYY